MQPWEFFCTAGMRSNVWTMIPVPSCWEQQGFGAYGYQADPLAEQGKYRHRFLCRFDWTLARFPLPQEGTVGHTAFAQGAPREAVC